MTKVLDSTPAKEEFDMALDDPDLPTQGVFPNEEELKDCITVTVRQPRSDLDFSILLPDGWYQQPAPIDKIDFSQESEFVPLALFSAAKEMLPPILFTVGVRPAPKKGNVAEWLERQCYLQQLALERIKLNKFPFGWAAEAVALQASEFGKLKLRITMFEDGNRLFALIGMAPLDVWDVWVVPLGLCVNTFELLEPKGQSAPLAPKYEDPKPEGE
ncbi:hypothetical protein [Polyangium sorediatum]|uniref:DUF2169 domain-containing protein n=1 Tax=Polyangium sorediatum TaxID=889274 RepID=A0ABT6P809_9BACT|nr:hypothetical protein [Polyangium sorediatum]MDI1436427.1 hypothetical protein [Polyangium sorediatum]